MPKHNPISKIHHSSYSAWVSHIINFPITQRSHASTVSNPFCQQLCKSIRMNFREVLRVSQWVFSLICYCAHVLCESFLAAVCASLFEERLHLRFSSFSPEPTGLMPLGKQRREIRESGWHAGATCHQPSRKLIQFHPLQH